MNGKGTGPERGRNFKKYRTGYDGINWGRKRVDAKKLKPQKTRRA